MTTATWKLPRELEVLADEMLARTRACEWAIDPDMLARSIRVTGWCPPDLASAAERELLRLHRVELAFLLREAARLRIEAAAAATSRADSRLSLRAWRTCFREAVRCAARDGARASQELLRLLRGCRSSDLNAWPDAVALAGAALALHDVGAGRVGLGEALLATGRAFEACGAFARALTHGRNQRDCTLALSGLTQARAAVTRNSKRPVNPERSAI